MSITHLTDLSEYKEIIKKSCIIKFSAKWCGPCKKIAPRYLEWSKEFDNIEFLEIDVDEAADITSFEHVTAMPTFILYDNGKKIKTITGGNEPAINMELKLMSTKAVENVENVETEESVVTQEDMMKDAGLIINSDELSDDSSLESYSEKSESDSE